MRSWSGVKTVLVFTAVAFVLDQLLRVSSRDVWSMTDWFGLRARWPGDGFTFNLFFVPQLVTYGLVHADFGHIFWNMIGLWIFGAETDATQGRASFLRFYIGAVVFAGLVYWLLGITGVLSPFTPVVGASGGVSALLVYFVLRDPHRMIMLIFPPVPIPAWLLGGVFLFPDMIGFARQLQTGGAGGGSAHQAHLAGAVFGYLWFRHGDFIARWGTRRKIEKQVVNLEKVDDNRREMDRILAKIQASGLSSLDKKEKSFLEQRSQEFRKGKRS